uniref:Reverse transcriptase domain-containing protein n=1 Tax=Tanacetum cinerariifolium TaxID=118510 RepID=A0A6L2N0N9_TANCI|nr:reverse transcriptase domain-containing protein [Tanacetum cinerariifolium]
MGYLPRSACLWSLSLNQFPEFNRPWGKFGGPRLPIVGPIGFVLKFDRKIACLSIHKLVRSTPDGCLIDPQDHKKTTFTCPYGTFAYRRMPFGLCNAPGMFQRCMMAIFHDMIEKTMEVFMDDISVFGAKNLAADYLSRLENPHQDELKKKEITETFPLETLGMIDFRGDLSTPWFADIANCNARNFIVKGMSSQQKKKFFKDVKHYI